MHHLSFFIFLTWLHQETLNIPKLYFLLLLYLHLNSFLKFQLLNWFFPISRCVWVFNFLIKHTYLCFVFLIKCIYIYNWRVFRIRLGLYMLKRTGRFPLLTWCLVIYMNLFPKNILAVLFIINLVIELLRGTKRLFCFKKPTLPGGTGLYID